MTKKASNYSSAGPAVSDKVYQEARKVSFGLELRYSDRFLLFGTKIRFFGKRGYKLYAQH